MTQLDVLQNKIEQLLQKYDLLLEENKSLKEIIASQTQKIKQLNESLAELELTLNPKNVLSENYNSREIKNQLDKIIIEVNKIMDSINE